MIGTSSPQGVIEIYGLVLPSTVQGDAETAALDAKNSQRGVAALRAMMQARDYKWVYFECFVLVVSLSLVI